ncbi:hypothetical protein [Actinomycetospora sp. TBRC 11914]|uniref:hypothetical protein n=1 Tax=Actinomycetospora sp. TBRC 11914 TaxID=2729387 RepID=UPI00145ECA85|nr:hypothetical protein [Actinomycetospora sp. TBRC 11914]NMO93127.1 hypothetical protein [Actinomycetospora sp. TBRC 11914]
MTNLAALLDTWQTWSAREVMTRATGYAPDEELTVSTLDALCASTELVDVLTGSRWQAIHAARVEGASWEQIGIATGTIAEDARTTYAAVLEAQRSVLGRDVSLYRHVL